jgi:hypothetical protein
MGQVQLLAKLIAVERFVVISMEARVDIVEWRSRVLPFPQARFSLNIMEDDIELVGLIREPAVLEENIWPFLSLKLTGNADGFAGRRVGSKYWRWARIQRRQPVQPNE